MGQKRLLEVDCVGPNADNDFLVTVECPKRGAFNFMLATTAAALRPLDAPPPTTSPTPSTAPESAPAAATSVTDDGSGATSEARLDIEAMSKRELRKYLDDRKIAFQTTVGVETLRQLALKTLEDEPAASLTEVKT